MTTWRRLEPWDALPVYTLMRAFYDRRIGAGEVPDARIWDSIGRCTGDYPHMEGWAVFEDQTLAGYAMLSRVYDPGEGTEHLLLQEFYIDKPFRAAGCGPGFLRALPSLYPGCGRILIPDTAPEGVWRPLGYRRTAVLYGAVCPSAGKTAP